MAKIKTVRRMKVGEGKFKNKTETFEVNDSVLSNIIFLEKKNPNTLKIFVNGKMIYKR